MQHAEKQNRWFCPPSVNDDFDYGTSRIRWHCIQNVNETTEIVTGVPTPQKIFSWQCLLSVVFYTVLHEMRLITMAPCQEALSGKLQYIVNCHRF